MRLSPLPRHKTQINIVFHGSLADSGTSNKFRNEGGGKPSKGLVNVKGGIVDIHGKQFHPTWTRLSRIVSPGDTLIYLQDEVNWEVGQEILLVTSDWYDCPSEWQVGFPPFLPFSLFTGKQTEKLVRE